LQWKQWKLFLAKTLKPFLIATLKKDNRFAQMRFLLLKRNKMIIDPEEAKRHYLSDFS
jgi:hypothetical protein